jgi:hypothetical protein
MLLHGKESVLCKKVGCISSGGSENVHLERNYRSDGGIPDEGT